MDLLKDLAEYVKTTSTAPTLHNMPRSTLADKGIAGPTGAHFIEEMHTPHNLAYITTTTGSTAFQNIVGVTSSEIANRVLASAKALQLAGVKKGDHILITYPPLVNVFSKDGLQSYGVTWSFLQASSRDALLLALCKDKPAVVLGESSFLRATLEDAQKMGLTQHLPTGAIFIACGTPLDQELIAVAGRVCSGIVHDLYGCQEFGWLTLDGIPLRDDIVLMPSSSAGYSELIVGGLPTGDCFAVLEPTGSTANGHCCNHLGKIITYSRIRSQDLETTILQTTAKSPQTIEKLAKTILRIKAKIVRVSPNLVVNGAHTIISIAPFSSTSGSSSNNHASFVISDPSKTTLLDTLLQSQLDYQGKSKNDPTWLKER